VRQSGGCAVRKIGRGDEGLQLGASLVEGGAGHEMLDDDAAVARQALGDARAGGVGGESFDGHAHSYSDRVAAGKKGAAYAVDRAGGLGQESLMLRRGLGLGLVALLGFAATTLVALEGREVVVVRTHDADGEEHTTRTWIADAEGASWIEAANPERPFLQDVVRTSTLVLDRGGASHRCRASVLPNPTGHARIRELLAEKYGWADRWVALVADTERSLAVRLECDAPEGTRAG
jgi:hypothetical protein